MLARPFLTDLDTRAKVKGSVDPLGAMPIWTRLGRKVVGNLSTVTTSVRDFKTLLLGLALLQDLKRTAGPEQDIDSLAAFLRWEQLAAYTRAKSGDWEFRGERRVRARLPDGVVPISARPDAQILGNQKVYGLWGLFTVPSRSSGLIDRDTNELTTAAADFVAHVWRRKLSPVWNPLLKTISVDSRRFNLERHDSLLRSIRPIWAKTADDERAFWRKHLVLGGPTDRTAGRQTVLARLLRDTLADKNFKLSQRSIRKLAADAKRADPALSARLLDIAACESVLAFADAAFSYLQTQDGRPVADAVKGIRAAWGNELKLVDRSGFLALHEDLREATRSHVVPQEWLSLSNDLADGRWEDMVLRLVRLNRLVMEDRSGSAWLTLENGVFRVRYRAEDAVLPSGRDLRNLWRYTYFLESLRSIVGELEER